MNRSANKSYEYGLFCLDCSTREYIDSQKQGTSKSLMGGYPSYDECKKNTDFWQPDAVRIRTLCEAMTGKFDSQSRNMLRSRLACKLAIAPSDVDRMCLDEVADAWEAHELAKTGETHFSEGFLSVRKLAEKHGVDVEKLRRRLDRWKQNHDGDWIENRERGPREPRYLYRADAVRPIIEAMKAGK